MAALGPRCQACGGAITGNQTAVLSRAPDGRTIWWLHAALADCMQALGLPPTKARNAA